MRISRHSRKEEPKRIYHYNESIPWPQVRVIDADGKYKDVMNRNFTNNMIAHFIFFFFKQKTAYEITR